MSHATYPVSRAEQEIREFGEELRTARIESLGLSAKDLVGLALQGKDERARHNATQIYLKAEKGVPVELTATVSTVLGTIAELGGPDLRERWAKLCEQALGRARFARRSRGQRKAAAQRGRELRAAEAVLAQQAEAPQKAQPRLGGPSIRGQASSREYVTKRDYDTARSPEHERLIQFGKDLRTERQRRNISQIALATSAGLRGSAIYGQTTLSRAELGMISPATAGSVTKVVEKLGDPRLTQQWNGILRDDLPRIVTQQNILRSRQKAADGMRKHAAERKAKLEAAAERIAPKPQNGTPPATVSPTEVAELIRGLGDEARLQILKAILGAR